MPTYAGSSTHSTVFQVYSPDGFVIDPENEYLSVPEARAALTKWAQQFAVQGFYSSPDHGRIPLDELPMYCKLTEEETKIYLTEEEEE